MPGRSTRSSCLGATSSCASAATAPISSAAKTARRFGPYVTELVDGDGKPRTASLFKTMTPESVTLEDALRLLTLPRTIGESEGEEVVAANGRYGPYVKKGKESRSLETEEQLFAITLDEALAKLAEPRARGRQAKPPLKE